MKSPKSREIVKILIAFTDAIRPYIDDLLATYDFLGTIDFIRAKALFAIANQCRNAGPDRSAGFRWKQAVHPLLFLHHKKENKEVVPLDIYLDEKEPHSADLRTQCRRKIGLPENGGTGAIHAAMRIAGPHGGKLRSRHFQGHPD